MEVRDLIRVEREALEQAERERAVHGIAEIETLGVLAMAATAYELSKLCNQLEFLRGAVGRIG